MSGPLYLRMGRHCRSSIQRSDSYSRLGLEKSFSFPSGARSPEVSKREEARSFYVGLACTRTSLLADHHSLGEKGSPWGGWALLLWLSVSLGSASDHLASCLLDFGLDLREDSQGQKAQVKYISLPDSKPQIAPAQRCGGWSVLTFPEEPDTSSSLLGTRDIKATWEAEEPIIQVCMCRKYTGWLNPSVCPWRKEPLEETGSKHNCNILCQMQGYAW